jgi:hypothetical protein
MFTVAMPLRSCRSEPMDWLFRYLCLKLTLSKVADALALPNTFVWQMTDVRMKMPPELKLAEVSEPSRLWGQGSGDTRKCSGFAPSGLPARLANPPEIIPEPVKPKARGPDHS